MLPASTSRARRYARHIVLREVGGPGQQQLKAARVLVIGAGGLGSPLIQYLAAAGVGELGIVDDDDRVALQPAAPGAARDRRHRPAQGGQRGGNRARLNPQ